MTQGLFHDTEVLLNPRLPATETKKLQSLAGQYFLAEHVWIASSGSTRSLKESVKLIALSHKALRASAKAVNLHLESSSRDRWAQVLPRFHVGGLGVEVRAELSGAKVVSALMPTPEGGLTWDAKYFIETCQNQKLTLGSLVPAQVFDLVAAGLVAPESLRAIVVGGGALSPDLYQRARILGWPLLPSYGMTEACSQVATAGLSSLEKSGDHFSGDRFSGNNFSMPTELKILSPLEARQDQNGCLLLRGSSLLTGYAQIREGEYIWVDPKTPEGWLLTEDLVELRQGLLKPLGRQGDYFKILGEGVSLMLLQQKLEMALMNKGFSASAAVIVARPDRRQGAELFIVFDSTVPEKAQEDLRYEYNLQVLPYEKVHRIEEVDQIPRSELGKLKRTELMYKLRSL